MFEVWKYVDVVWARMGPVIGIKRNDTMKGTCRFLKENLHFFDNCTKELFGFAVEKKCDTKRACDRLSGSRRGPFALELFTSSQSHEECFLLSLFLLHTLVCMYVEGGTGGEGGGG